MTADSESSDNEEAYEFSEESIITVGGGYTGVDVSFVISGYVVSSSVIQHSNSSVLEFSPAAMRDGPSVML